MISYCIWQVTPPKPYIHSQAFDEVTLGLQCALGELGYDALVVKNSELIPQTHRTIIIGANLIPSRHPLLPRSIVWNFEQITKDSPWIASGYLDVLRNAQTVWDYSESNITALRIEGINASLLPVGYVPELTRIAKPVLQDLDISFFGSINERRQVIIRDFQKRGLKVVARFGVYGQRRDDIIARSKICLNMHFYESKTFEAVRCSYLLANRKCIVSEVGNDPSLEHKFRDALVFVPYERIVDACEHLLKHEEARLAIEQDGFDVFAEMRQSEFLKAVLE